MRYYTFDHATGAYTGLFGEAHECQKEEGVYHLPAWATYEVPPSADDSTAYFVDGKWDLRKNPTPEEVVATLGATLTPEEKKTDMEAFARLNIERAAVWVGFKDTSDALSYCGEDTQRGHNADAFKTWRALAMEAVDAMVSRSMSTTDSLPTHEEWNAMLHAIPFVRKIKPPPTILPEEPVQTLDEYTALLEEALRVEKLVK